MGSDHEPFEWGSPVRGLPPSRTPPEPYHAEAAATEPAIPASTGGATPSMPERAGRRWQRLSRWALVLAVLAALILGYACYRALGAIDLVSFDPLGPALGWSAVAAVAAVGALAALVLAGIAAVVARPRATALVAVAVACLLPVGTVLLATGFGLADIRTRAEAEIGVGGPEVAAAVGQALERFGVDLGPVGPLLEGATGG